MVDESPDWIGSTSPPASWCIRAPATGAHALLNGLLHRYPELAQVARAGIVHRLDKDISGSMVARTRSRRPIWRASCRRAAWAANTWPWRMAAGRRRQGGPPEWLRSSVPVRMSVEGPVAPKPAVTHYAPARRGEVEPAGASAK